jgi:hypothetical protein
MSSTKVAKRPEQALPGSEGGEGGEMAQIMYAHMNKLIKKKKERISINCAPWTRSISTTWKLLRNVHSAEPNRDLLNQKTPRVGPGNLF